MRHTLFPQLVFGDPELFLNGSKSSLNTEKGKVLENKVFLFGFLFYKNRIHQGKLNNGLKRSLSDHVHSDNVKVGDSYALTLMLMFAHVIHLNSWCLLAILMHNFINHFLKTYFPYIWNIFH